MKLTANLATLDHPRPASRSWHREPWPWLLMAGPAIVVVAGLVTFWLAWSSDDGVIAEDYYKQGLLINRELARIARAEVVHLGAIVRVGADGVVGAELRGEPTDDPFPNEIRLRLVHPTRAGRDRSARLPRRSDGTYGGWIEPPPFAHWYVVLENDVWELPAVHTDGRLDEVKLGAARAPH